MNVLDLAQRKVRLRKVASTHGGEWQGPCPGCGGRDRFHVWPQQQDGRGSYWCRQCDKAGDSIQFLIDFEGKAFREACAELRLDIPGRPASWRPEPPRNIKAEFHPASPPPPEELWRERAEKFLAWSQEQLDENAEVLAWLADRGIRAEVARDHRLGWNPGENGKDLYRARSAWGLPESRREDGRLRALRIPVGLVIPYLAAGTVLRLRIRRPEGEPRYYVVPGSSPATMVLGRGRRAFVIVESELDAIAVVSNNDLAGAVALGTASAKPDAGACELLRGSLQILNSLDYDAAGAKAAAWWKENFSRCERWPVPQGKDPGEAYRMGLDLTGWIKEGLPPALTLEAKAAVKEKEAGAAVKPGKEPPSLPRVEGFLQPELPPGIAELRELLRRNPAVRIINTKDRFTVLRDGKYVGGRINFLVFRDPVVRDYLMRHPAEEITGANLVK